MTRTLPMLSLVCLAAGCKCGAPAPTAPDGGVLVVNLPPEVVKALRAGIPVDIVDNQVLTTIDPSKPKSAISFWQEFEYAPAMTMVNLSQPVVARTENLLKLTPSSDDEPGVPPLERDLAFCDRTEQGHEELPIPTSPSGTYVLGAGLIKRIRGSITALRATITSSTSLTLTMTLTGLDADVQQGSVHFDSVDVTCPVTIGSAVGTCGDTLVRCVGPTVTTTGFAGGGPLFGPGVPTGLILTAAFAEQSLVNLLSAGVNLHFQNFAATGLTLDSFGMLVVTGSENLGCSPWPEVDQPAPPTRGLTRLASSVGHGELIGDKGDVIPFELVPEVQVRWEFSGFTRDLMPFTPLTAAMHVAADEHPFGNQVGLRATAHLKRVFKDHCFVPR